jgi:hypothetical protein
VVTSIATKSLAQYDTFHPILTFATLRPRYKMVRQRLDTIPSEIYLIIIYYLPIQDLMHLYQTSHYWRRNIGCNQALWRSLYRRSFGYGPIEDSWLIWALRKLFYQSSSEEKRSAARYVHLDMLEHLDAQTWYRLVRGRYLTEKNWRQNTPQRSNLFLTQQSGNSADPYYLEWLHLFYGFAFTTRGLEETYLAITDDPWMKSVSDKDIQVEQSCHSLLSSFLTSKRTGKREVTISPMILLNQSERNFMFFPWHQNDEFLVVIKKVSDQHIESFPTWMLVAWDISLVEVHKLDTRSTLCLPKPCMVQLIISESCKPLKCQYGWALVKENVAYKDPRTQLLYHRYRLFDVRRNRLAAVISIEKKACVTLGHTTSDKAQIYYGYTEPQSDDALMMSDESVTLYQYNWCIIEVSLQSFSSIPVTDSSWYDQELGTDRVEAAFKKDHAINTQVNEQRYWCDEAYLLNVNTCKESITLPEGLGPKILVRYLIDDLFLLSRRPCPYGEDILAVHSVRRHHMLWSRTTLMMDVPIPEEKVIFNYDYTGKAQLLDMYTGKVLSSLELEYGGYVGRIIGPLCYNICDSRCTVIDVRAGKELYKLTPDGSVYPFINEMRRRKEVLDMMHPTWSDSSQIEALLSMSVSTAGPTRVEYHSMSNVIWVDNYAQI